MEAPNPLFAIRKQLKLTQEQFAKRLGISRPYLSTMEKPSAQLAPKLMQKLTELCQSCGITALGSSTGIRSIPMRSWAQAGAGIDFDELALDSQRQIPTDCPDDTAFAVEIQGDSMEPKFLQGDIAILMRSRPATNGSVVVARLENEGVVLKVFTARSGPSGRICSFTSYNSVYHPIEVSERSVLWVFPVYQIIRQVWRQ